MTEPLTLKDEIARLKPGDHLCCIYETEEEHRAILTPFMRQGLERHEKVVYIVDERTTEAVLGYLRDDGLDPHAFVASGQLVMLTQQDTYMREGTFDPAGMIAMLASETAKALDEGYAALRVTEEMTWALRGLPGSERLIEHETLLNTFFPSHLALAICQYDRRRFKPALLLDVLRTHPIAMLGSEIFDNVYFVPPEQLLSPERSEHELRHWITTLTDLKRAGERRRKIESLLNDMGHMAKVGGWEMDLETQDQVWTDEVYAIHELEKPYDPALHGGISLYAPQSRPAIEWCVQRAVEFGEPFDGEFEIITAKGNHRWVRSIGRAVQVNGITKKLSGTLQDVTERKRAEAREREQDRARRESFAATERLIQSLAHELRNPLFAISVNAAVLEKKATAVPEMAEHIGYVKEHVQRLESLMRDLLELGRQPSEGEAVACSLNDVAAAAILAVEDQFPESSRRIRVGVSEVPSIVRAAPDRLQRALTHLIQNALQHSANESPVSLRVSQSRGNAVVEVRDEGPGIPQKIRDRLFEPFLTTRVSHRGLGLALAKHYVTSMGGILEGNNNQPPPGATFTVSLPVAGE